MRELPIYYWVICNSHFLHDRYLGKASDGNLSISQYITHGFEILKGISGLLLQYEIKYLI